MIRLSLACLIVIGACRGTPTVMPTPPPQTDTPCASITCPPPRTCPSIPPPVALPCDEPESDPSIHSDKPRMTLHRVTFGDLPGWNNDNLAQTLPALLASCSQLDGLPGRARVGTGQYAARARDWRPACRAAKAVPVGDNRAARAFFEQQFRAYAAHGSQGATGKLTGYYVQEVSGSRQRGGAYQFPIMARPPDLVSIQLSEFIADGRSRRVWGRVDTTTGKVVPYPTRAELRKRPAHPPNVLLWLDSPADAIAIEIEGSGKATLDDGSEVWIHFAGKNGRRGRRLGSVMREMRRFERAHGDSAWTDADIERFFQIADFKRSIVFFDIEMRAGAIGTQDVVLTPQRSIAVDRGLIPLSTPVWVDTTAPRSAKGRHRPFRKLLIAQDTGGSILGPIRGDIYFGDDAQAAAIGRRVNGPGRMWLLLPRGFRAPSRSAQ